MPRSAKLQKIATSLFNQVFAYYLWTLIGVTHAALTYGFPQRLETTQLIAIEHGLTSQRLLVYFPEALIEVLALFLCPVATLKFKKT